MGTALALRAEAGAAKARVPALLVLTDPDRLPAKLALDLIADLPAGSGLVLRTFGRADQSEAAMALRTATRARGLCLLISDPALARTVAADGVHLPERSLDQAQGLRQAWPQALLTAAAHSPAAIHEADAQPLDALLVSPVFASDSPSAGADLGPDGLADLVRVSRHPVLALGGITAQTAAGLAGTGAAGLAVVGAALRP